MSSYKPHYACFNCRKTFKRKLIFDIDRNLEPGKDETPAKCPQCGNLMADMGLDFESPKKSNLKAWQHVQNLYIADITFHSCGCTGPGYIPKDLEELLSYLKKVKAKYIDHRRFWEHRNPPKGDREQQKDWDSNKDYLIRVPNEFIEGTRRKKQINSSKAIEHWNNNIIAIDSRINQLMRA